MAPRQLRSVDGRERAALDFALASGVTPSEAGASHPRRFAYFTDEEVRSLIGSVAMGFMNRYNDSPPPSPTKNQLRGLWQTSARSAGISVNTSAPITTTIWAAWRMKRQTTKP